MSLPSKMSGSIGTNPCSLSMLWDFGYVHRGRAQLRVLNSLAERVELTPSGTNILDGRYSVFGT